MSAIWVAIITGGFTFLGTIISVIWGNKKNEKSVKQQTDLTLYRIDQLEQKVNKHNNLIERMYKVEKNEAELNKDIEAIKERIDHLHND